MGAYRRLACPRCAHQLVRKVYEPKVCVFRVLECPIATYEEESRGVVQRMPIQLVINDSFREYLPAIDV